MVSVAGGVGVGTNVGAAHGVGCLGGGVGVLGLGAVGGLREGFAFILGGWEVIRSAGLDASSSSSMSVETFRVKRRFLRFVGCGAGASISSNIAFLFLE